ncbi:hypothetical protein [Glutamicibacter mishrai]|uniref:hypothetical protein n=1 Tax=Glutamicibacter mishrai TaxID=1775880 RepID=UPI001558FB9C|nr:hypothetical protein [Glutamicibacter mishrai]
MNLRDAENDGNPFNNRTVGQPIYEVALTSSLRKNAKLLLPPGPGRSVVVIPEAAIGRGRPDVLLVVVSISSLHSYIHSGLKIYSLNHAREITSKLLDSNQMKKKNPFDGWTRNSFRQFSNSVNNSLAVEAKIKDWKQAVRQASRFKHLAHRSAIMMPNARLSERLNPYLKTYDLGLISFSGAEPTWIEPAHKQFLRPENQLWLLELAARQFKN